MMISIMTGMSYQQKLQQCAVVTSVTCTCTWLAKGFVPDTYFLFCFYVRHASFCVFAPIWKVD